MKEIPSLKVVGGLVQSMVPFRPCQLGLDCCCDGEGDLVLKFEDVVQFAVVAFSPDVIAACRFDQLRGDTDAVGSLADASLKDITHTEFLPDLLDVDGGAFVGECRIACGHEEPAELGKRGDYVFRNPVGEELLLGIARHILERQHRDRWLVGER